VRPIDITYEKKKFISESIILVFTKIQRSSSQIHETSPALNKDKYFELMHKNKQHAVLLSTLLETDDDLNVIANIFNESWEIKKKINPHSITPELEILRSRCLKAGAKGVKVMGAGGGGFLALWINPEEKEEIKNRLRDLLVVPIAITDTGSEVIFNNNALEVIK
jgi:D-glycero-alpha-D-manno-heptose-7-phosphate kinase